MNIHNLLFLDQSKSEIRQEIFSAGVWNGKKFSVDDLKEMVKAYNVLKDVLKLPLKLGHDDDQPYTDGEPAIGWMTDVVLNDTKNPAKLEAVFSISSPIVMTAIQKGMYRTVSVEMYEDVTYKGQRLPFVLTGVALLGAQLPAVNNLNDLGKYFASDQETEGLKFANKLSFNINEEDSMDPELKKALEKIEALESKQSEFSVQNKTLATENKVLKDAAEKREADDKLAKFTARKEKFSADCEKLVKADHISPAMREELNKDVTEDNIEIKFSAISLFMAKLDEDTKTVDTTEQGRKQQFSNTNRGGTPDQQLNLAAKKIQAGQKVSYSQALELAMDENPELAQEWADQDLTA